MVFHWSCLCHHGSYTSPIDLRSLTLCRDSVTVHDARHPPADALTSLICDIGKDKAETAQGLNHSIQSKQTAIIGRAAAVLKNEIAIDAFSLGGCPSSHCHHDGSDHGLLYHQSSNVSTCSEWIAFLPFDPTAAALSIACHIKANHFLLVALQGLVPPHSHSSYRLFSSSHSSLLS